MPSTTFEGGDARLKELGGRLEAKRKELRALLDEAGPELDASKITSRQVADGKELMEVVLGLNGEVDALKDEYDKRAKLLEVAKEATTAEPVEHEAPRTIGAAFTASSAFRDYHAGQGVGPVASLDVSLRDILRQATLFQTSAGWAPESTRTGIVSTFPTRPAPHVVDFIATTTTSQAAVKFMEETTYTNAAAETAEGGSYPEAALALTERTMPVQKVAVWLPTTDEQLEDEPGARDYIDQRLRFMLAQRIDLQVLRGNGTAPNLLGTANVSGIQSQTQGADTLEEAIYKAMVSVRSDGFAEPSVIFLSPANWQTIRLRKTADGVYIYGAPTDPGPERLWGVPVVPTVVMSGATELALLGDYATHAALYSRRGVDVQVTNSHGTHFVEGKLAIRADVRVAMVHYRPKAFGKVV